MYINVYTFPKDFLIRAEYLLVLVFADATINNFIQNRLISPLIIVIIAPTNNPLYK